MLLNKMKNSFLSILVLFSMTVALFPVDVVVANTLTVRDKVMDFTTDKIEKQTDTTSWGNPQTENIDAATEGWSWDYANRVLTLSEFQFDGGSASFAALMKLPAGATINVTSTANFKARNSETSILSDGNLSITGAGTLTIGATGVASNYGINVGGTLSTTITALNIQANVSGIKSVNLDVTDTTLNSNSTSDYAIDVANRANFNSGFVSAKTEATVSGIHVASITTAKKMYTTSATKSSTEVDTTTLLTLDENGNFLNESGNISNVVYVGTGTLDKTVDIANGSIAFATEENDDCTALDPHIVTGNSTSNAVSVESGTHYIKLKDVNITSTSTSPIAIKSGAVFYLELEGTNILTALEPLIMKPMLEFTFLKELLFSSQGQVH